MDGAGKNQGTHNPSTEKNAYLEICQIPHQFKQRRDWFWASQSYSWPKQLADDANSAQRNRRVGEREGKHRKRKRINETFYIYTTIH